LLVFVVGERAFQDCPLVTNTPKTPRFPIA
jgi:hypothetical protein